MYQVLEIFSNNIFFIRQANIFLFDYGCDTILYIYYYIGDPTTVHFLLDVDIIKMRDGDKLLYQKVGKGVLNIIDEIAEQRKKHKCKVNDNAEVGGFFSVLGLTSRDFAIFSDDETGLSYLDISIISALCIGSFFIGFFVVDDSTFYFMCNL